MIKKLLVWLLTQYQLRVLYRFRSVGRNIRLDKSLFIYPHRVSLGDDVFIGRYSFLDGDIEIGNGVMLAGSVAIVGGDHVFREVGVPLFASPREHWNKTVVGDDAWIGHGATVLNGRTIGRGAIVDLTALTQALNEGLVAGAALDVYETEPLPADHPLWGMENAILTPHIAGYSPRIAERHLEVLLDNVGRHRRGEPLRNVVNKAEWF